MHSAPPPTLTPVDRNKAYCFHELVLNLPALLDILLQGGGARHGSPQPLTPSAAYECRSVSTPTLPILTYNKQIIV